MRILVTGCAGFIGWKVSELLLRQGHTVVGIDNLNHSYDVRLKEWRLSSIQPEPAFSFHRLDIANREAFIHLFRENSFEVVINLAAQAGVRRSIEDPWVYYSTNVVGTLSLLELCREYEVRKFVLASTSSVYGNGKQPFQEDHPSDRPLSQYAASKKAAETLAYTYHHLYGLDITVLRYFTVYGPAGRPDMSIFRFVRWLAEEEPLIVYGGGRQERDFTYVDDIAAGTVAALRPLGYEIINLGNASPVKLQAVITLLEELLGKKARIDRKPPHPSDVSGTWADISKAQMLLGWRPETKLRAGLGEVVDWYRQNRTWAKGLSLA